MTIYTSEHLPPAAMNQDPRARDRQGEGKASERRRQRGRAGGEGWRGQKKVDVKKGPARRHGLDDLVEQHVASSDRAPNFPHDNVD